MSSTPTINALKYNTIECRYFPRPRVMETPEIELVYINKGEGTSLAGDGIAPFRTGDILLFSGHLAHYIKSAKQFYSPQYPLRCGATTIQFGRETLPAELAQLRECSNISRVVECARRGVKWRAERVDPAIIEGIERMDRLGGFERMLQLYTILDGLGKVVDHGELIASERVLLGGASGGSNSNKAYLRSIDYIVRNFDRQITLDELANHVGINKTALCRHFKAQVGRSIFDVVMELRIGYAKELLSSTRLAISEVASDSGFNNLPNFNVQFKRLVGSTPGEYRSHQR